jgi:predicted porin
MKKQLLASTALVAAGLVTAAADMAYAQQKGGPAVSLGVGGYMRQEFGVILDRQDANTNGRPDTTGIGTNTGTQFDQQSDVEVYFLGLGKLDNGIEVGARVELEVAGSPGNMIDEHYLFTRGSFGQFELGATDSAAIKATLGYMGSWATQVGDNSAFGPGDWLNGALAGGGGTFGGQDGTLRNMQLRMFDDDGNKISYFTPRFAGFQVGVSYTPNAAQNTQNGAGATELTTTTQQIYHDFWALGANFDRKFNQFGVGVAAGYVRGKSPGASGADTATTWANTDDPTTWGVGASLEFGPFKVALGYRQNNDVRDNFGAAGGVPAGTPVAGAGSGTSLDGSLYDIGARYTFGPNAVSLTYRSGDIEGTRADTAEPEEQAFMASYRRTLAPGVNWDANLIYQNSETEPAAVAGTNAPREVSGWAITTAIQLNF